MTTHLDRAFNYLDAKIQTLRKCFESTIDRTTKLSNQTALTAIRTVENDVIKTFGLDDSRSTRNNLRVYIVDKLAEDV